MQRLFCLRRQPWVRLGPCLMRMLFMRPLTLNLMIACGLCGSLQAGGAFDISLSNDSVRLVHEAAHLGTGLMFDVGLNYSEPYGWALSAGLNAVDTKSAGNDLVGGLGGKIYVFEATGQELAGSLAVGGFVRYTPAVLRGLGFEVISYVAPSVLSFGEHHAMLDAHARLSYRALPQANVFVGYGYFNAFYDKADQPIDQGPYLGFRVNY